MGDESGDNEDDKLEKRWKWGRLNLAKWIKIDSRCGQGDAYRKERFNIF